MIEFAIAALTGVVVKAVDQIEDVFKGQSPFRYPLAALYGIMIGYLISSSSLSTLWLAVLVGQLLAGKVDKPGHIIGGITAVLFFAVFGIYELVPLSLAFFFACALLDELNPLKWPQEWRPAVKVAALGYAFLGRWDYLAGIMLFDIFYFITGKLVKKA